MQRMRAKSEVGQVVKSSQRHHNTRDTPPTQHHRVHARTDALGQFISHAKHNSPLLKVKDSCVVQFTRYNNPSNPSNPR